MDYLKESYVFLEDEIRLATMLFFFPITYLRSVQIKEKKKNKTKITAKMAMTFSEGKSKSLLGISGVKQLIG